jgi:hypothetical protein
MTGDASERCSVVWRNLAGLQIPLWRSSALSSLAPLSARRREEPQRPGIGRSSQGSQRRRLRRSEILELRKAASTSGQTLSLRTCLWVAPSLVPLAFAWELSKIPEVDPFPFALEHLLPRRRRLCSGISVAPSPRGRSAGDEDSQGRNHRTMPRLEASRGAV